MKPLVLSIMLQFVVFSLNAQVVLVKDIWPGKGHSDNSWKTEYNGKLYFMAKDSATGVELWQYDGINLPSIVTDLNPAPANSGILYEHQKGVIINNVLYLGANNGIKGNELYKFDGTNFTLVADIAAGSNSSDPVWLTEFNGKLFFGASKAGNNTFQLFTYDPVTNIIQERAFPNSKPIYIPHQFIPFKGRLYFTAKDTANNFELYSYDPMSDTIRVEPEIAPGLAGADIRNPVVLNNILYFSAVNLSFGRELYRYDGVSAPVRLTDLRPGWMDGLPHLFDAIISYNNRIYFSGSTGSSGADILYQFDPVTDSITPLEPVTNMPSGLRNFIIYDNKLYFTSQKFNSDEKLRVYDGIAINEVASLQPPKASWASEFTVWNNKLYMNLCMDTLIGRELYVVDASLGIANVGFAGSISMFPNPSSGIFNFDIKQDHAEILKLLITDVKGRYIYSMDIKESKEQRIDVDLSGFSSGVFYYQLTNAKGRLYSTGKIVKQ